ncbi:MAG: hypothetical protein KC416_17120, partial [Myxococcales bacterium]|nr:hypothetical protein [Myxococcales bacterium]
NADGESPNKDRACFQVPPSIAASLASAPCAAATKGCIDNCIATAQMTGDQAAATNCVNNCLTSDPTPPADYMGQPINCAACINGEFTTCAAANGCADAYGDYACCVADSGCTDQGCVSQKCGANASAFQQCIQTSQTAAQACATSYTSGVYAGCYGS